MRAVIHLFVISVLLLAALNPIWFWQSNNGKKYPRNTAKIAVRFFISYTHICMKTFPKSRLDYINICKNNVLVLDIIIKTEYKCHLILNTLQSHALPPWIQIITALISIARLLSKVKHSTKLHRIDLFFQGLNSISLCHFLPINQTNTKAHEYQLCDWEESE